MTAAAPRTTGFRAGMRRVSTALIAYGAVALVAGLIGLVVLFGATARLGTVGDRLVAELTRLDALMLRSADALDDASGTALSFANTIERSVPTVEQVATIIGNLQDRLIQIESQMESFSILGNQPLAGVGGSIGDIGRDLEDLDTRLDGIAGELDEDKAALLRNSESLKALSAELRSLEERLKGDVINEAVRDLQLIVFALTLVVIAIAVVPAVAALWIGLWLRRQLRPSSARPGPGA